MHIRPYTPADLPAIRWLHDRTPPAGQVSVTPQRWPEMLDDIPAHFEAFWVATETQGGDEAIVGMAGLQVVRGTDPDLLATGNIGCMTQIAQYLEVPVVHTVELLDWATGGPIPPALEGRTLREQPTDADPEPTAASEETSSSNDNTSGFW